MSARLQVERREDMVKMPMPRRNAPPGEGLKGESWVCFSLDRQGFID
jgi:hypothetical protein